jgi:hypothetical protein
MADALIAAPPAQPAASSAAARTGAIVLARHGEPALSRKVKLNAAEYRQFWARYEVLGIVPGQTPPSPLMDFVAKAGNFLASTRLRSIESATALAQGREFARNALFIEAPLPPPNWPRWLRLSPPMWGFIARFWWWFFNHHEGQETRRQAESRADQAADILIELAAGGEDVVLLAHGFFNFMIGRALKRRGWRLASSQGYKYWSVRRFERG